MRDRSENKIVLTLIRHGSTKGNEEKRYIGRTDEELSKKGEADILEKKQIYDGCDLLFVSPMKRCRQTADILFPDKEAVVIDEWREMDFGRFEGKNYTELSEDVEYKRWVDEGCKGKIPDGEAFDDFVKRLLNGFEKCVKVCKNAITTKDINVTAVVHGGTIMALLSSLTDSDFFDYHVKNGEGYMLELEDDRLIAYKKLC